VGKDPYRKGEQHQKNKERLQRYEKDAAHRHIRNNQLVRA
jgi:hypothetical protein